MRKISVLTPSFNSGMYIENAILSVVNQKYKNFEHIIVDNRSTDNTLEIVKKYPHLKWISEKDKGQSDAMNKAFDLSTGEIIVYLNADDYFADQVFETIADEFDNHNKIDIIVGNGIEIHANGRMETWYSEIDYSKILQFYKFQSPLNPVSYFYKRNVQNKIKFNVHNHFNMDYEFLLRAYQLFRIKKIEKNLGFFLQHANNKSSKNNTYAECKKTALRHCYKYDITKLLIYLPYFFKRKILRLPL